MLVATWNVEWASAISPRGKLMHEALLTLQPEVISLTETHLDWFDSAGGYTVTGGHDWGYSGTTNRRKVLLWSRQPWTLVRSEGPPQMPPGRFVAGVTKTSIGEVQVCGVCIPWRNAHVRTGRRDMSPWEDHEAYLQASTMAYVQQTS